MVTVMADLTSHIQLVATYYWHFTCTNWQTTFTEPWQTAQLVGTMAHSPWCEDVGWV